MLIMRECIGQILSNLVKKVGNGQYRMRLNVAMLQDRYRTVRMGTRAFGTPPHSDSSITPLIVRQHWLQSRVHDFSDT